LSLSGLPFPFSAVVGQERMKTALIINAINPSVGGVLIKGERGTGKSTAVRALADLLPEIEVSADCRFSCHPTEVNRMCEGCSLLLAEGSGLPSAKRKVRLVDLPLNASEDRVVGTIDIEAAIQRGEKVFEPGLLARANRSILYIDEVNLLDDHIVDILLDAAAMGVNVVEREGISYAHPATFIMIGTMNPEEGELRPQLEDRFGLCVEVKGERDCTARAEIIRRRQSFLADPRALREAFTAEQENLRERIARAQSFLPEVALSDPMLELITHIAVEFEVCGHRADIAMMNAALACAALEGKPEVEVEHIKAVAEFALAHRLRKGPFDQEMKDIKRLDHILEKRLAPAPLRIQPGGEDMPAAANRPTGGADEAEGPAGRSEVPPQQLEEKRRESADAATPLPKLEPAAAARGVRSGNGGKRTPSVTDTGAGRTVGARIPRADRDEEVRDIAFDATIRAAAGRVRGDDGALQIHREDLRTKVRKRKVGNLVLFVVDASASMGAAARMTATREAILALLKDAYQKRDRVGLIAFKDERASLVLSPTSSVQLAGIYLKELATGGATPLSHGLALGLQVIRKEMQRDPDTLPVMALITDGYGNVSISSDDPLKESLAQAQAIQSEGVKSLVLDTHRNGGTSSSPAYRLGTPARRIAQALGADYHQLEQPQAERIVSWVEKSLHR
jgi:magnesium chelatase subunit D